MAVEDIDYPHDRLRPLLFRQKALQRGHAGAGIRTRHFQGPARTLPYIERYHIRYIQICERTAGRPLQPQDSHVGRSAALRIDQLHHLLQPFDELFRQCAGRRGKGDNDARIYHRFALGAERLLPGNGSAAVHQPHVPLDQAFRTCYQAVHLECFTLYRSRPHQRDVRFHPEALRLQQLAALLRHPGSHRSSGSHRIVLHIEGHTFFRRPS